MIKLLTVMSLATLLAACETTQQTAALECGAGGAGVAFLLCKAAGGSNATCAAVGVGAGTLGGFACYSLSDHLQKRRDALAGHENDLDARIAYVKGVNEDTAKYNQELKTQVADLTRHTDQVVQQVQQKTIDAKALDQQRKALDTALKQSQDSVVAQRKALDDMRSFQAAQASKNRDLTAEVQRQQMQLAQTEAQSNAIAAQRQRI